ncbi:MAG: hypothetical protein HPY62_05785 [Bacteroidales bacterium]|nr:hypothetical protein [Bacteroidales bacterium]
MRELPEIKPPFASPDDIPFLPYRRDDEKHTRFWAIPGTKGLEHRIGGLEKTVKGTVSYVPENHELMVKLRALKVEKVADDIPDLEVSGSTEGDLLVISWGGSFGYAMTAVNELINQGYSVGAVNLNYINPLPKNLKEVLKKFKKIVVCELNMGQLANYLRMKYQEFSYLQINKVQGLPFTVSEIKEQCIKILEENKL